MNVLLILMPAAIALGGLGLVAFLWSLRSNQYEDLEGEAERILFERPAAGARSEQKQEDRAD